MSASTPAERLRAALLDCILEGERRDEELVDVEVALLREVLDALPQEGQVLDHEGKRWWVEQSTRCEDCYGRGFVTATKTDGRGAEGRLQCTCAGTGRRLLSPLELTHRLRPAPSPGEPQPETTAAPVEARERNKPQHG